MKKLFVLIGIVLFLSSCDRPIYYDIPENEKPILKDKDTVVFIDKKNNKIDSFLIKRTDDYRVSDKRYYREEIVIQYNKINESSSITEFYFEYMTANSIYVYNRIYVDGSYFPTYGNVDTISVTINGINYQSVFVKHATNFPDSIPSTVYYTQKYGIVRYDYSDGNYYELN